MSADNLIKIRMKLADALRVGVVDEKNHGTMTQLVLQLVTEAERGKQSCEASIVRLQEQIERTRGKIDGYSQVASIAYAVLDGLVTQAERSSLEEQRLRTEKAAQEEADSRLSPPSLDTAEADVETEAPSGRGRKQKK